MKQSDTPLFQQALLQHYQQHGRNLPWRNTTDPYQVWLAEIMLQQTTVATVIPYYERFLAAFPDVTALAKASLDDVFHLWQGLGYYRRAQNLHRCAQVVATDHQGVFPTFEQGLLDLPGIGPYTAAAIMAFAYNQPSTVVDGNIERIISRLFAITTPLPSAKPILKRHAAQLASQDYPRDYANAMMDLGATICTPTTPKCNACPVANFCTGFKHGTPTHYPVKAPKQQKPHKQGVVYCLFDRNGHLFLRQRPQNGLLGNLWEAPHTGWEKQKDLPEKEFFTHFHQNSPKNMQISHVFTHFKLTLQVKVGEIPGVHPKNHAFALTALPPLPTLMRKVIDTALLSRS